MIPGPDYSADLQAALAAAVRVLEKLQPGESVFQKVSGVSVRIETPEAAEERKQEVTECILDLLE